MTERSNYESSATTDGRPRNRRLWIIGVVLTGIALTAVLGVYASIPLKEQRSDAPQDKTAEAIRDLQKSHQQASDQLTVVQQALSSDQAEIKRLSDNVTALTGKIEALQQSFARGQQVPPVQPTEPRQKRAPAR